MAFIHKYSEDGDKRLLRQIALLGGIGGFLAVFMAVTSENFMEEWKVILGISVFVIILFMVISYKTNPLGWMKLVQRKKFDKIQAVSERINENLEELDDRTFVFNWLIMEFFQLDYLIISPKGIFVAAVVESGNLNIENNILYSEELSLEKTTAKLWRVSNMINILFKKGFKKELMPKPVIAVNDDKVSVSSFKGIDIVRADRLASFISSHGDDLDENMAAGFAKFVAERYVFKNENSRGKAGKK